VDRPLVTALADKVLHLCRYDLKPSTVSNLQALSPPPTQAVFSNMVCLTQDVFVISTNCGAANKR
jgi:hypothetical protein